MEITVFTAIFGGYDTLRDPVVTEPGVRYVCFTDAPQPTNVWEVVVQDRQQSTPALDARMRKVLAHRFLPNTRQSVWMDGNVRLLRPVVRQLCQEHLIENDIAVFPHGERDCIQQEAHACTVLQKAKRSDIEQQIARYFEEGYPKHHGLVETNVLLRRHTSEVGIFNETWWIELTRETHRDQLSFNYTCWKLGVEYTEIDGNVRLGRCPWAHYYTNHG